MKYFVLPTILFSSFLLSCASQPANAQAGDEPVFHVATKHQEDEINIEQDNHITMVDIDSPSGIGSATLSLRSGSMPERVVVRLHLAGLEQFKLVSDQAALTAYGSSNGVFNITGQSVMSGGNEYAISPVDPLWVRVDVVSEQTDQEIPLEEGYFEITIPKEFLRTAENSFEIQWIDFFR